MTTEFTDINANKLPNASTCSPLKRHWMGAIWSRLNCNTMEYSLITSSWESGHITNENIIQDLVKTCPSHMFPGLHIFMFLTRGHDTAMTILRQWPQWSATAVPQSTSLVGFFGQTLNCLWYLTLHTAQGGPAYSDVLGESKPQESLTPKTLGIWVRGYPKHGDTQTTVTREVLQPPYFLQLERSYLQHATWTSILKELANHE